MKDLAPGDLVKVTTLNLTPGEVNGRCVWIGEVGRVVKCFLTALEDVMIEFPDGATAFTTRDNIRALSALELLAMEGA